MRQSFAARSVAMKSHSGGWHLKVSANVPVHPWLPVPIQPVFGGSWASLSTWKTVGLSLYQVLAPVPLVSLCNFDVLDWPWVALGLAS